MSYIDFIDGIVKERGRFGCIGYKERHHIIPRHAGGTDDESNLIDLYAHEHYVAHKMLAHETGNYYDVLAVGKKAWETRRRNGTVGSGYNGRWVSVRNAETGEIFLSMKAASRAVHGRVERAIKTGGTAGGCHWERVEDGN